MKPTFKNSSQKVLSSTKTQSYTYWQVSTNGCIPIFWADSRWILKKRCYRGKYKKTCNTKIKRYEN
ncbi:GW dipeptide domain-containing protein [Tetzosporium hominis]|uniref:GW dipeptide domain-containing protein n=1 Tax=Tetzosporium hominis TaxID=2020506 RepID=UPI0034E07976